MSPVPSGGEISVERLNLSWLCCNALLPCRLMGQISSEKYAVIKNIRCSQLLIADGLACRKYLRFMTAQAKGSTPLSWARLHGLLQRGGGCHLNEVFFFYDCIGLT